MNVEYTHIEQVKRLLLYKDDQAGLALQMFITLYLIWCQIAHIIPYLQIFT